MQAEMLDSIVSSHSQELPNASSALKLFENPLFKVRVIMRCSDPWFVAKDVATCIEHKDVTSMCKLCREKDKVVESASNFDSAKSAESGNARITLISESGLYRILATLLFRRGGDFRVRKRRIGLHIQSASGHPEIGLDDKNNPA